MELEQIPQGILDELSQYGKVFLDNYGNVDFETESRRINYTETKELEEARTIMTAVMGGDTETVSGETHVISTTFMVRINMLPTIRIEGASAEFTNDAIDLRQVLCTGDVLTKRK